MRWVSSVSSLRNSLLLVSGDRLRSLQNIESEFDILFCFFFIWYCCKLIVFVDFSWCEFVYLFFFQFLFCIYFVFCCSVVLRIWDFF